MGNAGGAAIWPRLLKPLAAYLAVQPMVGGVRDASHRRRGQVAWGFKVRVSREIACEDRGACCALEAVVHDSPYCVHAAYKYNTHACVAWHNIIQVFTEISDLNSDYRVQ
jgi:hypothetical protein